MTHAECPAQFALEFRAGRTAARPLRRRSLIRDPNPPLSSHTHLLCMRRDPSTAALQNEPPVIDNQYTLEYISLRQYFHQTVYMKSRENLMTSDPVEVTREVFVRFGKADVPGILELLDDNVVIEFYGPPIIPYANTYHGKERARRFFETVLSSVDIHQFEPEQFLNDGDMVTVTGRLHLTARSTGKDFRSDFAHVITVRGGKWKRFRDFMNTAVAVQAFSA